MSRVAVDTLDGHLAHQLWMNWFAAAANGNAELMASYLHDYELPLDRTGPGGMTALALAFERGHEEVVELLLRHGADPWVSEGHAPTAAEHAATRGDAARVAAFTAGPNPNRPPLWRHHLLWGAAIAGQRELAQALLDTGADPNWKRPPLGYAALHQCAVLGTTSMVPWLVERGAQVNALSAKGWSPLLLAIKGGHLETAHALLAAGANPNIAEPELGLTPLMHAAALGEEALVDTLVEAGAKLGVVGRQAGRTAAGWAEAAGHTELTAHLKTLTEAESARVQAAIATTAPEPEADADPWGEHQGTLVGRLAPNVPGDLGTWLDEDHEALREGFSTMKVRLARRPTENDPLGVLQLSRGLGLGAVVTVRQAGAEVSLEVKPFSRADTLLAVGALLGGLVAAGAVWLPLTANFLYRYTTHIASLSLGVGVVGALVTGLLLWPLTRRFHDTEGSHALVERVSRYLEAAWVGRCESLSSRR